MPLPKAFFTALVLTVTTAIFGAGLAVNKQLETEPISLVYDPRAAEDEKAAAIATGQLKERIDAELRWKTTVFLNWAYEQEVARYLEAAARAEAERAAAAAAANAQRRTISAPRGGGGAPVSGACTGGPVNETVVQNESGGNPNARNPSGAWGCWQIMPGTWSSLGCAGTHGSASVDQQRDCANKVFAAQGRGAWEAAG